MSSKSFRDAAPSVKVNGDTESGYFIPSEDIQCGSNMANLTLPEGCDDMDDATTFDTCLMDLSVAHLDDPITLLTLDISQSVCADSEIYATIDWEYNCGDEEDDAIDVTDKQNDQIIEYQKNYKASMNGNKNSVPVTQKVKMHLRHGK